MACEVDQSFMRLALALASRGIETTHPNPRVGCIVVSGKEVVGQGWHSHAGGPHAEIVALAEAGETANGSTLYVTLEPCSHYGRTPPCVNAIIASGIQRVVIAMLDPNPLVNGRGVHALRDAGISVDVGTLGDEAKELNLGFLSCILRRRPWLRLKVGMSLDARTSLSSGESKWITCPQSLADVHEWRARSSALMTTSATAIADDPRLTVRRPDQVLRRAPVRVLLDCSLRVQSEANVLDGSAPTIVFHSRKCRPAGRGGENLEYVALQEGEDGLDLIEAMSELARRNLGEVQVESGPRLAGALMSAALVDELLVYMAPLVLGSSARPILDLLEPATLASASRLYIRESERIGDDIRLLFRIAPLL